MIEYLIDDQAGTIVARFSEDVGFDDLLQWYESIQKDEHFSNQLDGITDMRGARMALTRDDMARIFTYIVKRRLALGRWALLIEEPKVTALTMIYERYIGDVHESEVFSSEEGASEYLGVDVGGMLGALSRS